jgi:photosystem II stability/assembly factor-like uncharacterized protein
MNANTFIAINRNGLALAQRQTNGDWSVEFLLEDKDPCCLAIDPFNRNRLYAGIQGGGVLHSDDCGHTWRSVGMQGQVVKSLAISPHYPGTIYAGTRPAYLFISRDYGQTWAELTGFGRIPNRWWWFSPAEKPYQAYVQAITISPTDPSVILAGIEFGAVVRSEDGGQTWSGHRPEALRDCHSLMFHATNGNWIYEAGGTGGGASVSRDGGQTWRQVKAGLDKHYGVACAADPERPEVWYVSVAPNPGKAYKKQAEAYLYRATGGASWQPIGWEPHPMRQMPIALITDPGAPGHLYAGTINGDVWHSPDYGNTWQQMPFNLKGIWRSMIMI